MVTVIAGKDGNITPNGHVIVKKGEDQEFRIFGIKDGYEVANVYLDGKSVGAVTKYTINTYKLKGCDDGQVRSVIA